MTNVIIVGNCQAAPLAHTLEQLPEIGQARGIAVHERGTKHFAEIDAELQPLLDRADTHVFTFPVKDEMGGYATAALRQRAARVKTITNVYFEGLHPDVTYVGPMSARIPSPLGDYHSRIILDAFCEGRSEAECRTMFNAAEYLRRGYLDAYDKSAKELLARDQGVDVPFAEEFLGMVREFPTLMTFNHPTSVVFQAHGARIAKQLGLKLPQFPAPYVKNPLAGSVLWPIYRELGQAHGLKYGTPMVFRQADSRGGSFFSLPELIKRSYAMYTKLGDELKHAWSASTAALAA